MEMGEMAFYQMLVASENDMYWLGDAFAADVDCKAGDDSWRSAGIGQSGSWKFHDGKPDRRV